jgi:ABC-type Zn uptake system ZnuABC Zn-binding protein ZnuA
MKKIFNSINALVLLTLLLSACAGPAPQTNTGNLHVLATTTFLADITQNVAGNRAQVESLLPVGADPHAYQAAPSDVAKIAKSTVLIQNGIEYEHFLGPLLENAGGQRAIITATDGLTPNQMDSEETPGQKVGDPHMWLDPVLVITYVENIRDGLIQADPAGAETYKANADAYIAQIKDLDAWVRTQVESVPAERRLLVTNHEALGYFAQEYGFTVVGSILPSLSSEASASAQEIAASVDAIKASGAPAIFLGEVENAKLAEQIASETGVQVVNDLHLESLTDGAPAATYIEMMKYNVTRIVEALK